MVLLAVRHSAGGLVGAGSKCPLRNPDELVGRTKAFRTSGDVVCKAPITTVPSTPQSEDAGSEANTCSPPLEPAPWGEGEVESLFDMVPASAAAVPCDHGIGMDDGLELDLELPGDHDRGFGDESMDPVEQWVSSGNIGGGPQDSSMWPPAHGGYPDPSKAIEWRRQPEPFLRHYPCSHSGGGRRTEFQPDRIFRARPEAKQEAMEQHKLEGAPASEQEQQEQQQVPQVPSCRSAAPHDAHGAGMPRHHAMPGVSNRVKARQMLRERITRRLQAMDGRRASENRMQA